MGKVTKIFISFVLNGVALAGPPTMFTRNQGISPCQMAQIQNTVNEILGQVESCFPGDPDFPPDLYVVGSRVRGEGRGCIGQGPMGKGPGTISDIDYLVPRNTNLARDRLGLYFEDTPFCPKVGGSTKLPLLDWHGPMACDSPPTGPYIKFSPGRPPEFVNGAVKPSCSPKLKSPGCSSRIPRGARGAGAVAVEMSATVLIDIWARNALGDDPMAQRFWNFYDCANMSPVQAMNMGQCEYSDLVRSEQDKYLSDLDLIRSSGGIIPEDAIRRARSYRQSQCDFYGDQAAHDELQRRR